MIVKNKREKLTIIASDGAGATPLRLVSGAAPVVDARHASGICADWEKKI
jgi:hypothetical protein